jgi:hypothetical protein
LHARCATWAPVVPRQTRSRIVPKIALRKLSQAVICVCMLIVLDTTCFPPRA